MSQFTQSSGLPFQIKWSSQTPKDHPVQAHLCNMYTKYTSLSLMLSMDMYHVGTVTVSYSSMTFAPLVLYANHLFLVYLPPTTASHNPL